jgi:SNF2 family DNA or RNA helicase/uncharacterized Zn finger protein
MKKYAKNWWANQWFELLNNEEVKKAFAEGKKFYKHSWGFEPEIKNNILLEEAYEFRRFEPLWNNPKIKFKNFTKDERNIIKILIEKSPSYLIALTKNNLPKQLYYELLSLNIHIIPKSLDELEISCECREYCKHTMRLYYFFGLEIDKDPLLIFKIKGLDLLPLIDPYKKMVVSNPIKKIDLKRENPKHITVKDFKDIDLDNIPNFDNIPKLKEIIDLLLDSQPDFFISDFKPILLKNLAYLSRHSNVFIQGDRLKLNFKPFIAKRENESEQDYEIRIFLMKWDEPKYLKDLQINLRDDYRIKNISIIPQDDNLEYVFHEFFFEMPDGLIEEYNYPIQFTYKLYQFSQKLIEKIAIIPEILYDDKNYTHFIKWIPALFNEDVNDIFEKLSASCPQDLLKFNGENVPTNEQVKFILDLFIRNFMLFNNPKANDNHSTYLEYMLFFEDDPLDLRPDSNKLINKWLYKLFLFESERKIQLSVLEEDDQFHINLLMNDLEQFNEEFDKITDLKSRFDILLDIQLLTNYYPDINDTVNKNKKVSYNLDGFNNFYFKTLPLLKALNFKVNLPSNLEKEFKPEIIGNINTNLTTDSISNTNLLNLESIIDFDWKIAIGDKKINIIEFRKLIGTSSSFIKIDGKHYLLNPKITNNVSNKVKNLPKNPKNNEILQTILSSQYQDIDINFDKNIKSLVNKINRYEEVKIPDNLNGKLRPYQNRGVSWLIQNIRTGFGSILADDMGLGKTLEVLTTILYLKNEGYLNKKKVLVIAPTAILYNWQKEIENFTPDLICDIFHLENKSINLKSDIIITSYGMIRTNFDSFKKIKWFLIAVDEAQNIKNPNTQQSKLIKKLDGEHKIALTGTPIENRLTDYWSIFDFTNNNYLYNLRKFKKNFVNPIEKENDFKTLENFKKICSPFVLRRLKTDKNVIADLPEKVINDSYCFLTKSQTALYQKVIDNILDEIKKSEGIQRKGLVLKLINSLKQICNHPAQFSKSDEYSIEESGKMEMLVDILENIEENKEKVIIFTQYVQVGSIIAELLEEKFNIDVLFYHGSLTRKNRDNIVEEFQNDFKKRVMIVSLKAGGTGLNLTAASHVIHFDLWWNPAVENQATDRVHRIGQENRIMVYRLITKGTFEEKINQMIMSKRKLAELAIDTDEKFVTEMNDNELKDLLSLKSYE